MHWTLLLSQSGNYLQPSAWHLSGIFTSISWSGNGQLIVFFTRHLPDVGTRKHDSTEEPNVQGEIMNIWMQV